MSELFMECEEEELEPWQKHILEVSLIDDDDDDDDPIFVGELVNNPKSVKPSPPPIRIDLLRPETQPQPPRGTLPMNQPASFFGNGQMTASPCLKTMPPQPVIINSQGFIVQPQLTSTNLIATLGKQYPPGTSFTIVPAGQQHLLPLIPQGRIMPGVVHRPQVKLNNNVVTLSNVQSPAVYSSSVPQPASNQPPKTPEFIQVHPLLTVEGKGAQSSLKRVLPAQHNEVAKKAKVDPAQQKKVVEKVVMKKCPKCKVEFHTEDALKSHMMSCCASLVKSVSPPFPYKSAPDANKHILLVSEFYYGRVEGDWQMQRQEHKTNTTFKCRSCHKVLKNNIRFMNHMKHHMELEKQCSESWESHTTCQHCYRQYLTPFQLQCHVERAHSLMASSTNCKICELAFETEQLLLEHMKVTHKPGEMPYVCQVCNFRSSFFMEVDAHFKVAHDNTKDLLCPFCLKVLRMGHVYMAHYMKHQRKSIHRCGKCRLNFLTHKERVDHKINYHKTFKKPKALEGLRPGTKVTIRASITGNPSSFNPVSSNPGVNNPKPGRSKPKPAQVLGKAKPTQSKKQQGRPIAKKSLTLKHTSTGDGQHTCIECSTTVTNFSSHYPMISNCGACKYQTSCKVSISNHMIRFHSTISKDRFWKMGNQRNPNSSVKTLQCLDCDFRVGASGVGASGGDKMTKHLIDQPNHVCRVIQQKVSILAGLRNEDQNLPALEPTKCFYFATIVEKPKDADLTQSKASEGLAGATVDKQAGATLDKEAGGAEGTVDKVTGGTVDKEAGATLDKEAGGAEGTVDKQAGGTEGKEARGTVDREAKEAPAASSAEASVPPLSPSVGTFEEGAPVLDDFLGGSVGIDQVRACQQSPGRLQEELIC